VEVGVAVTRGDDGSHDGLQGTLFDDSDVPGLPGDPDQPAMALSADDGAEMGYRGPTACSAAGITYRQLDYWARTGLVEPSVRAAHGSGSQRLYSFRDILVLKVVKRLLDTGISLQQIRAAVQHLRDRGSADLAQVTLMSDGVSVYECGAAGRHRLPGRPGQAPPAPHQLTLCFPRGDDPPGDPPDPGGKPFPPDPLGPSGR
jgi:DNA-binding transcriptional MerR regulator